MHIPHHSFDRQKLEAYYESELRSIESSKKMFDEGSYFVLKDTYNNALAAAYCSVVLGKPKEEIKNNFYLFLDIAIAKYKMGTHVGEEITFAFLGKEYKYTPEAKRYSLTDQGWITAFFAALLFMDLGKISELNKIDLDKVMEVTKVQGGEYTLLFARFLQHVFKGDQNNFDNLKKASDKIKPELLSKDIYDFALEITGGQIDLFGAALLKETPHFNEVYLKAVQWYKDYYSKHNPESETALFAMELTAICMLAKHYKIEIEHSSDYTPKVFLDGF